MDLIKDREIKKLEKTLDKKAKLSLDKSDSNFNSIIVGYQYRRPLEVLKNDDEKAFNRIKEDMYIENMINSYIFIFDGIKMEVFEEDWKTFKDIILNYLLSLNVVSQYSKCILRIVESTFSHCKTKIININNLIENVIVLSENGYNIEELFRLKQHLREKIEQKIVNLEEYKKR